MTIYCSCETPIIDWDHDAGCRRCGLPVDFSPTASEEDRLRSRISLLEARIAMKDAELAWARATLARLSVRKVSGPTVFPDRYTKTLDSGRDVEEAVEETSRRMQHVPRVEDEPDDPPSTVRFTSEDAWQAYEESRGDLAMRPEILPCVRCGGRQRRVVGLRVSGGADPTEVYTLRCGHVTI